MPEIGERVIFFTWFGGPYVGYVVKITKKQIHVGMSPVDTVPYHAHPNQVYKVTEEALDLVDKVNRLEGEVIGAKNQLRRFPKA